MTILDALKRLRGGGSGKTGMESSRADSPRIDEAPRQVSTGPLATELCRHGDALLSRGEYESALDAFQQVIDLGGEAAAGHFGQARAYLALERRQDAADSLEVALAIDPTSTDALIVLARIRREADALDDALELLNRARVLAPKDESILAELASTLDRSGKADDAIAVYEEAIRLAPEHPGLSVNLGLIHLLQRGDPIRAEAYFRSALEIDPDLVAAHANLGLALHDQERYDDEREVYRHALTRWPENVELSWNQALAHLSSGDFERGWPGYECRLQRRGGRDLSGFHYPAWNGSASRNAQLLVLAEQGLGDEVMFASCVPDLIHMADTVVLECAPRLERLFARSFPAVEVHGRDRDAPKDWLGRYPNIVGKVAIGSLPMHLRRSRSDFPMRAGFLRADPARVSFYRRLLANSGPGMTIGLSWRGGTRATGSALRSIDLMAMKPLLALERVRFVSLQHLPDARETQLARDLGITQVDAPSDIDELAALMSALDLMITVDNLNLHLAGALGRPAWGLLGPSPDWRWLNEGDTSPWYPTVRILRMRDHGGWEGVLAAMARQLQSCVCG